MSGNPILSLFISCDWGSSQLRLALVQAEEGTVLAKVRSSLGARQFFQEWQKSSTTSRLEFGQEKLAGELSQLSAQSGMSLAGLPLIISGMASSSLGISELPYAKTPFHLDGQNLITDFFPKNDTFPHDITLISGLQYEKEVMRGEEIQAIGIPQELTLEPGTWLLPGTHSKHMRISDGKIHAFQTILTGELFDLLSSHSTLAEGMEKQIETLTEDDVAAFEQGIDLGQKNQLLQDLFQVRSRRLEFSGSGRAMFLSGLLIGTELQPLTQGKDRIGLASGGRLAILYAHACKYLGMEDRLTVLDADIAERLTILGQCRVFQKSLQ